MKKTLMIATLMAITTGAFGQGAVRFQNRVAGVFITPIYGVNPAAPAVRLSGNSPTNTFAPGTTDYTGIPLPSGTGFSAALFQAPVGNNNIDGSTFVETLASSVRFSASATLPGVINGSNSVPIAGTPAGGAWNLQVRAWDNAGGTVLTWAAAMARPDLASGFSDVFSLNTVLPPGTQPNMTTFQSFNLTIVPEPSVIALGALGVGALLLRRIRRRS